MKHRTIFNSAARSAVSAKHPEYGLAEVYSEIATRTVDDFKRKHGHELDDLKEALKFLETQEI
jgi:hypothetical protein